jgi:hypothetical protein
MQEQKTISGSQDLRVSKDIVKEIIEEYEDWGLKF